jgi:hypothetical protein
MRARHARRRARLLAEQEAYVFNGAYPHRFVQAPILTPEELRRLAIGVPLAFLLALGLTAVLIGGVR